MKVLITGTSRGKGYAGVIKRWGAQRTPTSHGGGPVHRHAGSMGSGTDPSRILPGKIGAGHMGNEQVTVMNLDVVKVDPEFNLMVGTASAWYPALTIGVKGAVMALANCCPEECVQVQSLFDEGKYAESLALYKRVWPVNDAVTAKFGVAGLKYACNKLGYGGGYCRKPMLDVNEAKAAQIDAILQKAGLI